jgi:hypothetical protein
MMVKRNNHACWELNLTHPFTLLSYPSMSKREKKLDDHGKDKKLKDSIELLLESNSGRGS